MTFKEFKYLAEHPLDYEGQSLFRLDTYCYPDDIYKDDLPTLSREYSALYITLIDAESSFAVIKSKMQAKEMKIYCHFIYEIIVGNDIRDEKYLSIRVYDDNGNLTERSVCSQLHDKTISVFRGRTKTMLKHNIGDFVEIMSLYVECPLADISHALITDVPPSIEKSWELTQNISKDFTLNWIDDNYEYIDCPKYEMYDNRIHPIFVFKPRFNISDKTKRELIEYNNVEALIPTKYWREGGSEKDLIVSRVAAIDKRFQPSGPALTPEDFLPFYEASEYFETSISLYYYEDNPLDKIIKELLEQCPNIFEYYNGFIINFINTDVIGKKLNLRILCAWWTKLVSNYPNLRKLNNIKKVYSLRKSSNLYTLEIIAYK